MARIAVLVFVALLGACTTSPAPFSPQPARSAWIVGRDGGRIGQATFSHAPTGVLIRLEFSDRALPAGWHGVHVHGVGDCSDFAAGFQAAAAHAGHVGDGRHGLLNPAGPEPGDLPNLAAPAAGPFGVELFAPRLTLAPEATDERTPLLDADGSALVIHAGPDDHVSQPIGGAGPRIACAALTQLP